MLYYISPFYVDVITHALIDYDKSGEGYVMYLQVADPRILDTRPLPAGIVPTTENNYMFAEDGDFECLYKVLFKMTNGISPENFYVDVRIYYN